MNNYLCLLNTYNGKIEPLMFILKAKSYKQLKAKVAKDYNDSLIYDVSTLVVFTEQEIDKMRNLVKFYDWSVL